MWSDGLLLGSPVMGLLFVHCSWRRDADPVFPPPGSQRQRAKKITVACNFCRCKSSRRSLLQPDSPRFSHRLGGVAARKLKCDGGRPACGQCFKRSNPCDYTASTKRRTSGKQRKQYGSDSEGDSIEDGTADLDHPSRSPELSSSAPHSRRSSNVSMLLTDPLPPLSAAVEPREEGSATLPPIAGAGAGTTEFGGAHQHGARRPSMHTDLPPIATLSAPPHGPQDDGVSLVSFKDSEAVSRRRTSSAASGSTSSRGGGGGRSGSKIVACNFCRGTSADHRSPQRCSRCPAERTKCR